VSSRDRPDEALVIDRTFGNWRARSRVMHGGAMSTKRWLMTASLMAPGCGATFEQLQARAALDLECQPAAISAQSVDGQTRVASGCGKQAIYVESCSGHNHSDCTWMLNSTVKPAAAPSK